MRDNLRKYAHLLVHYSLSLHEGDKLLIVSTYLSEPLVREVYREALAVGAHPETWITLNGITRLPLRRGEHGAAYPCIPSLQPRRRAVPGVPYHQGAVSHAGAGDGRSGEEEDGQHRRGGYEAALPGAGSKRGACGGACANSPPTPRPRRAD